MAGPNQRTVERHAAIEIANPWRHLPDAASNAACQAAEQARAPTTDPPTSSRKESSDTLHRRFALELNQVVRGYFQ